MMYKHIANSININDRKTFLRNVWVSFASIIIIATNVIIALK
ncbi:hypothetical protein BN175_1170030 [Clostridioides difficile T23]|uniref:Uncharacterized protein n=1 Tax=Clostridioides difficile TaxID=1496 RepID=A0A069AB70_CLODI|nr:hypothetical protein BN163_820058 [Clostridioides difficile T5]CCK93444.1 hypothetical protein BN164_750059 [Clostridioides difficile T20]CCK97183.1 hypothetical protein BN165_770058 [Clostridioides difficile E1]CCL01210.1 hypothetical protein BN166_890029 [Clostridioides difficile E10]CCL01495.1 hypothetical protein BN167_1000059 [Clostridioides difficile E13]CCL06517.1 hypothetical protein BN168_400057 [Clostridioides difficile CD002]CCL10672.1 hypothetical protein BN169_620226 [Clostrid